MFYDYSFFITADVKPGEKTPCADFPGPGDAEHRVLMNPMLEYINNFDGHIDDMFNKFMSTHNKKYRDQTEHMEIQHLFRQNVRCGKDMVCVMQINN